MRRWFESISAFAGSSEAEQSGNRFESGESLLEGVGNSAQIPHPFIKNRNAAYV